MTPRVAHLRPHIDKSRRERDDHVIDILLNMSIYVHVNIRKYDNVFTSFYHNGMLFLTRGDFQSKLQIPALTETDGKILK